MRCIPRGYSGIEIYDNGSQGVRHDRVSMTDDLLMGIPVIIPSKEAQLKIAKLLDCLESRFQTELSQYESLKSIQFIYSQVILKSRLKSLLFFHEFMTSLPKLKKS